MPSSLLFAGLVATWLAVLVPMAARRRQPMPRPSEAALSCRVLERPRRREQEVNPMDDAMIEPERTEVEASSPSDAHWEPRVGEYPAPRYRPGRAGYGYDPRAAMSAGRTKYALRQRMALALFLTAVLTGLFAGCLSLSWGWSVHAGADLCLIGYLVYLRRQARLEQAMRRRAAQLPGNWVPPGPGLLKPDELQPSRYDHVPDAHRRRRPDRRRRTVAEEVAARAARAAASASARGVADTVAEADPVEAAAEPVETIAHSHSHSHSHSAGEPSVDSCPPGEEGSLGDDQPALPRLPPVQLPERPRGTVVLELDDEDPELHELDPPVWRGYRRAAGQ